jgi:hypothetical protein
MRLAGGKERAGGDPAADALLRELDELRELDRRRHAHAPGSPGYDAATSDLDARSRRLMDRFRDLLPGDRRRMEPEASQDGRGLH